MEAMELAYTPKVAQATAGLYGKLAKVVPEIEWPVHAPYVVAINALKRERNAVILAHNYMTPEIFHCVADFVGDSLALAREAAKTDATVIVQAGVHFMAETSKILSPGKTVLIPDLRAGCSLAASITGADVRLLKEKYPGPADRHLCQHLGRGEGRERRVLHLLQRQGRGRGHRARARRRHRDHDPRRVPRPEHRAPDRHQDHHLEGALRGA